ncbi:cysteine peptidase family C39 domain-containing protein [Roseateles sp. BYS78W]|uniref:Cysteine peptidase family C39 domain-containing protein n=1 Tax=Pelomonas candidula TaxID=3299025 RepID=A0ABW7HJT7_9BURK
MLIDPTLQTTGRNCGPAALRFFIQAFFGRHLEVSSEGDESEDNWTLAALIRAAQISSIELAAFECLHSELPSPPYIWLKPAIHEKRAHYVVVVGERACRELIFDPLVGFRSGVREEIGSRIIIK